MDVHGVFMVVQWGWTYHNYRFQMGFIKQQTSRPSPAWRFHTFVRLCSLQGTLGDVIFLRFAVRILAMIYRFFFKTFLTIKDIWTRS